MLNFESVLFDFARRERLANKTDAKLITSELTVFQIYWPEKALHDIEINFLKFSHCALMLLL